MLIKRISFVLALAVVLSFALATAAFANFGPHGGYVDDTDACAGCHRAHSSFSTVGWSDSLGNEHASALLVGSASTMTEFCNACHGNLAPGASTNVEAGIFDAGPSGDASASAGDEVDGVTIAYETASDFGGPLNGGGFLTMPDPDASFAPTATTSVHSMDADGPLWGAGSALPIKAGLTCTDCHDPHGTSNFRLLKASVNGVTVGGYEADGETPNPFVFSYEAGYPLPGVDASNPAGGFLKHEDGANQMVSYRPDYTGGTKIYHADGSMADDRESLSVWCAACHTGYAQVSASTSIAADYEIYESNLTNGNLVGEKNRHRHPVDITLSGGYDETNLTRSLAENVKADDRLPLEKSPGATEFYNQYLGCLTCHYAHGSASNMSGWAAAHLETNTAGVWIPVRDATPGVNPAKAVAGGLASVGGSALLRTDNRGVCERCHNK